MLPTPSTSHVNYDRIYEPAEDSYLLLDTLASPDETVFLHDRFLPARASPLILEAGVGSGVVLAFAAANAQHIFGRRDIVCIGTDVNFLACKASTTTAQLAVAQNAEGSGVLLDVVSGDLATAIRPGMVDVLIFNPPYVPTESLPSYDQEFVPPSSDSFARDSHLLSLSYAGGADGMETTHRLLQQLPVVLSPCGVAYVLLCAQNKPEKVCERMREMGWQALKVGDSGGRAGWEKLVIVRIWRMDAAGINIPN